VLTDGEGNPIIKTDCKVDLGNGKKRVPQVICNKLGLREILKTHQGLLGKMLVGLLDPDENIKHLDQKYATYRVYRSLVVPQQPAPALQSRRPEQNVYEEELRRVTAKMAKKVAAIQEDNVRSAALEAAARCRSKNETKTREELLEKVIGKKAREVQLSATIRKLRNILGEDPRDEVKEMIPLYAK